MIIPTSNEVADVAGTRGLLATPAAPHGHSRPEPDVLQSVLLQGRERTEMVMRAILVGVLIGSILGLAAGTAASRHVSVAIAAPAAGQQQVISTESRTLNI